MLAEDKIFDLLDRDGNGSIDRLEFDRMYKTMKHRLVHGHETEKALELKAARANRRFKLAAVLGCVLFAFLGLSVGCNFAVMLYLLEVRCLNDVSPMRSTSLPGFSLALCPSRLMMTSALTAGHQGDRGQQQWSAHRSRRPASRGGFHRHHRERHSTCTRKSQDTPTPLPGSQCASPSTRHPSA